MKKILIILLVSTLLCFTFSEETTILIPKGSSSKVIAQVLKENKLISSKTVFWLKVKMLGKKPIFYSGLMRIEKGLSTDKVIEQLQDRNRIEFIKVTIPEGYNLFQIDQLLSDKKITQPNEFYEFATNHETFVPLIQSLPYISSLNSIASLEGFIFPDTYFFDFYTPLEQIISTMINNYKQKALPLYQEFLAKNVEVTAVVKYRKNKRGRTYKEVQYVKQPRAPKQDFYKLMTLASIVESEAMADEERPIIASVYLNRLRVHMALGSCPTIEYSRLLQGLPHKERLSLDDLKIDSLYNTYRNYGLTPSPISNPGIKSIKAVLYPAKTNYYYFISKGDGTHHFSKSAAEHNLWQKKLLQ